ncbi:hypothetical protein BS47DRAFT_1489475 [Hydnum rufescens UP504]|uniref:BRCT domain-containing protein n=1 Tax=Hydnum rufescens UP504 TaxID=1448309 RepID=A0A9P6AI82_9AGAM|nr:hypothetical protein BS47DRAFT_1489475 [Hydnum rufescens UP504]
MPNGPANEGAGDLFDDLIYYLSPSLLPDHSRVVRAIMSKNGAKEAQRKDIRSATHIISESHFLERLEFGEVGLRDDVAIVTPQWVWSAVWLGRLPAARGFSTDPRMIFSGIVGCSSDIPAGDREAIAAGIQSLGGQWRNALTKEVTHLFVLTPGGDKYNSAIHYYNLIGQPYVVTPHWFDDSFKCQRVQPVTQYLFPDPPVLHSQSIISQILTAHKDEGEAVVSKLEQALAGKFGPPKIRTPQEREKDRQTSRENAAAAERLSIMKSVEAQASFENIDVPNGAGGEFNDLWDGRKIHISPTVNARLRGSIGVRVQAGGGIIVNDPERDDFDILVTPHTGGPIYDAARRDKKLIGTIEWLFYCHSTGRISFPDDHLVHIPCPKDTIPEFQATTLTISGYTGLSREYLKTLLSRMGAPVTPEMTRQSTKICVASKLNSAKTKFADQWGVPVVNHLWVEECVKQWRFVHPSVQAGRFTNYPPSVDYGNLLGQRIAHATRAESADTRRLPQGMASERVSETAASGDISMHEAPIRTSPIISPPGSASEIEQAVTLDGKDEENPLDGDRWSSPSAGSRRDSRTTSDIFIESKGHAAEAEEEENVRDHAPPSTAKVVLVEDVEMGEPPLHRSHGDGPISAVKQLNHTHSDEDSDDELLSAEQILAQNRAKTSTRQGWRSRFYSVVPQTGKARHTASVEMVDSDTESFSPPKRSGPAPKPRFSQKTTPAAAPRTTAMTPEILISGPNIPRRTNSVNPAAGPSRAPQRDKDLRRRESTTTPEADAPASPTPSKRSLKKRASENLLASNKASTSKAKSSNTKVSEGDSVAKSSRPTAVASSSRYTRDSVATSSDDGRSRRAAAVRARVGLAADIEDANAHSASLKASKGNIHKLSLGKRTRSEAMSTDEDGDSENGRSEMRHVKAKTLPKIVNIDESESETGRVRSKEPLPQRNVKIKILLTKAKIPTTSAAYKTIKKLAVLTENPAECTHLVSSMISRTSKFLRAMNVAPFVLKPEWVTESAKARRLLPEADFKLDDPDGEQKYHFILDEALQRAKRGKLFAGFTLYVTPKVGLNLEELEEVIKFAGGKMIKSSALQKRQAYKEKTFMISSYEDQNLWQDLASSGTPIYNHALVLNSILRQELDLDGLVETVALQLEDS